MREATAEALRARRWFLGLWVLLLALKLALGARLPLFVDEAFYWQEGMHPGWAYSDLPALTAWLARIGVSVGGTHVLALRLPFLLLAACVPWLVVRIGRLAGGETNAWRAGILALLLPLSGGLGLLALPDVAMTVAALLCLEGICRLLRGAGGIAAAELALGLVIGGLSHYRFAAVIGVGVIALLASARGRALLRDWRVWLAVAAGALAWVPLLAWNFSHAEAGLRFQLVDRHPWSFHGDGVAFVLVQALLATPLLFVALCLVGWRHWHDRDAAVRYLAWSGAMLVLGFFALGFFADDTRVSFHWPLQGMLALLPLAPGVLAGWRPAWRRATYALVACGLVATLGYYAAATMSAARATLVGTKAYPANFADWAPVVNAVQGLRARMPAGTKLLADNFKVGAELGFHLREPDIGVLDHPLNHKHGRAPQLSIWGLQSGETMRPPVLLVVAATDLKLRPLVDRYHALCDLFGPLPPPRVVNVDHGAQRLLLFALSTPRPDGDCVAPAIGHINLPVAGASVGPGFKLSGWAFKDGAGVANAWVTLDGKPIARADYGSVEPWAMRSLQGRSTDPAQPRIGVRATIDASAMAPGKHWLGLVVEGTDGSREALAEQPVWILEARR
jgi:4-amino-4-deoxy-L-arabinose transferase-like glycosyltransferase